jgi:glutathione S-transferase
MPTLYYYPGNASMAPHMALEEIGAPFELRLVDRTRNAHKDPAYLRLNPNGLIPAFVDGDLVLFESAAICLHLADRHPIAQLAPELGTAKRAQRYKFLIHLTKHGAGRAARLFLSRAPDR